MIGVLLVSNTSLIFCSSINCFFFYDITFGLLHRPFIQIFEQETSNLKTSKSIPYSLYSFIFCCGFYPKDFRARECQQFAHKSINPLIFLLFCLKTEVFTRSGKEFESDSCLYFIPIKKLS